MASVSTPWTVRTTKRKYPTSTPNPHKRHRNLEDVEDRRTSVRHKPRQQTLTQIQFVPHRSQDDGALDLEPIVNVPRIAQARQNVDRLRKRNSTLTQMDFLASSAIHDEHDDLTLILNADDDGVGDINDGGALLMQLDGLRDTPNPRRQNRTRSTGKATLKRKETPVISQESQEFKPTQKKRKIDDERAADVLEHGRRTSSRVASAKATRSIGLLSARHEGDQFDSIDSPSTRLVAAVPRAKIPPSLLQKPSWHSNQENQPLSQHKPSGAFVPGTPSKCKTVVPSSQSPESLPPSTRKTTGPGAVSRRLSHERSPLKERSVNAQLSQRTKDCQNHSPNHVQGPSPPKRKICVLKLPIHKLQQEQVPDEISKAFSKHSIRSTLSPSPRIEESEKRPVVLVPNLRYRTEDSESKEPAEKPLQAPTLEVGDNVDEEGLEVPGTSQVDCQRVPVSRTGTEKTKETLPSLRGLLGLREAPEEAMTLQRINQQTRAGHSGIEVKDFAVDNNQPRAPLLRKIGVEQDEPPSAEGPSVAFVADSEDEEDSVVVLSPGSSIANDTQFNAELTERLPTSSADPSPSLPATPRQSRPFSPLQLDREIELSLSYPGLVHQPSSYSTTKTVPLNDTSSSPSLPLRSTQRTVYPALLPRPSQVSTQDPTQSYLPMSSMPLTPLSSPTRSSPAVITIKDSSSVARPLRDIPSQRLSQSVSQSRLNIDLELDDCLDAEDEDDELDKELTALSDKVERVVDEQEESQVVPPPLQTSYTRDEGEMTFKTTEQGSPLQRRRRPRKPVIPPEVRALLGETFLESVPGPPGWSQRSWDDETL